MTGKEGKTSMTGWRRLQPGPRQRRDYDGHLLDWSVILLFTPIAILLYQTWVHIGLSIKYPALQGFIFLFQLAGAAIDLFIIKFFADLLYTDFPRPMASITTAIYLALTYLMAAIWLDLSGPLLGAVVVLTGTIGYFLGKRLSTRQPVGDDWGALGVELLLATVGVLALDYGPAVRLPASMPWWITPSLPWAGATLASIGVCGLFGRFPRTFLLTGMASAIFAVAAAQ